MPLSVPARSGLLAISVTLASCATPPRVGDASLSNEQMARLWKPEFLLLEVDGKTVQSDTNFNMSDVVYVPPGRPLMRFRLYVGDTGSVDGRLQMNFLVFEVHAELQAGHTYFVHKKVGDQGPALAINDMGVGYNDIPKFSTLYNGPEYFEAIEHRKNIGDPIPLE